MGPVDDEEERAQRARAPEHHREGDEIQALALLKPTVDHIADALDRFGRADHEHDGRDLRAISHRKRDPRDRGQRDRAGRETEGEIIAELILVSGVGGLNVSQLKIGEHHDRRADRQSQGEPPHHLRAAQLGQDDEHPPLTGAVDAASDERPEEVGPHRKRPKAGLLREGPGNGGRPMLERGVGAHRGCPIAATAGLPDGAPCAECAESGRNVGTMSCRIRTIRLPSFLAAAARSSLI